MKLRIGIVEDEILTAQSISIHLKKMGHECIGPFTRFETVFENQIDPFPDLFLIDIRLKGPKSGLDIAFELKRKDLAPFLFLTSNTDTETVREAMKISPLGYITKPFTFDDLFIGLELAKSKVNFSTIKRRKIEFRNGYQTESIPVDEILFLEAARSYVTIHMESDTCVLRQPLGNFLKLFEPGEMIRIHRSFAVNPRKIESIGNSSIIVGGKRAPLGPGYRKSFQEELTALNI